MKQITSMLVLLSAALCIHVVATAQSGYKLQKTFHIASSGGWDYITVDPQSKNLYVSHGAQVNILDKNTGDSLGFIPNTTGVHGIAVVHDFGKGYTSNGRLNNVTVFDLKTNQVLTQIATGENPDAIFYDDYSKKVITCNGRSKDLSVIDPVTGTVVATIPVGGKPETAVSDGAGKIFVNIEDKNEIVSIDANKFTVENRWSIAPGESPTGLAIDRQTKRLFAGGDGKTLIVLDAVSGKVVAKVTIGEGCDGVAFDPKLKYVFASNGEGTLTVIQELSADQYKVLDNVTTKRSARTCAVDESTHVVYLPAADMEAPAKQGERPRMLPGTFQVLVVGK